MAATEEVMVVELIAETYCFKEASSVVVEEAGFFFFFFLEAATAAPAPAPSTLILERME